MFPFEDSFVLGLNHPWVSCGHDFGLRPPAWQGAARTDWKKVEKDLRSWKKYAGVNWSRWWLLAGGVNYPVGENPDATFERTSERYGEEFQLSKHACPPPLSADFLDDFEKLLFTAMRTEVALIPSLLSFEFFFPLERQDPRGPVVSGGRSKLIFGRREVSLENAIDAFLNATLVPLLQVSQRYPKAIGMWEVVNEPDWVVRSGPLHARLQSWRVRIMPKTVPARSMSVFLERAVETIVRHGFVATIGFKQADPSWIGRRLRAKLRLLSTQGKYVHQLHYYPSLHEPSFLPDHAKLPLQPCLVGEMPTAHGKWLGLHHMRWLDEGNLCAHGNPARYLQERIELIKRKGYPGALLWSGNSTDKASAWTPSQWNQVQRAQEISVEKVTSVSE